MKKLSEFLLYNNLVPLTFGILFLGGAGAFAASPEVRDAVFEATEVVRSVDNTFILSADVEHYAYDVEIVSVTEDDDQFYIEYALSTIDLEDYVWQKVVKKKILQVAKGSVAREDLAQYVSLQLTQVREAERARLVETQEIERSLGASQKVVATEFSGLIGALVPPREEVVVEHTPVDEVPEQHVSDTQSGIVAGATAEHNGNGPTITIFGNNPATIKVGTSYADLGFLAFDNESDNVATYTYVNGKQALRGVVLDTTYDATHTITYEAIDPDGNVTRKDRTVIVGTGEEIEEVTLLEQNASTTLETPVDNVVTSEEISNEETVEE